MRSELSAFLVAAKRSTYASAADEALAAPALTGSKQLEYRAGRFTYHGTYFGMVRFAERITRDGRLIYRLDYCGGLIL